MMWDLNTGLADQKCSRHSSQAPNPAISLPQQGDATHPPVSHSGNPSYMSMPMPDMTTSHTALQPLPRYYPQQQPPGTEVIPHSLYQMPPQVIIIKESHRGHHGGRHKSHSRSHSAEHIVTSQPITCSTPDTPSHHKRLTTVEYPEPRQYSDSHHSQRRSSSHYHSDFQHHSHPDSPHRSGSHQHSDSYHRSDSHHRSGSHHLTSHHHLDVSMDHGKSTGSRFQQLPQPISAVIPAHQSDVEFLYSNCTGRKKALCIGINYRGQSHELRGCINDARSVRKWLMKFHGFKSEDIVLLADDTNEPRYLPTRQNLLNAMKWLVRSAKPHDSLFFHYSGHGSQVKDQDGDEADGFDEVIFPLDYKKKGVILDDDLHEIMVSHLPAGCRLTALFDSCHSGTVLGLPYIFTCDGAMRNDVAAGWRQKKASCADVISWSACKDGETSVDTFQDGVAVGAMSDAFISVLKEKPNQSYQDLLHSVRAIVGPKYDQTPQLGSSHPMDMSKKFIV